MTELVILLFSWEFFNLSAPLYCKSLVFSFHFTSFPLSFISSLAFQCLYGLNSFPSGFYSHVHGQTFKSMELIWIWNKNRSMLQPSASTSRSLHLDLFFSSKRAEERHTNTNTHTPRAQTYPVPSALSSALSKLTSSHLNPAHSSQSPLVPVDPDPQLLASYLGGKVNKRKAKEKKKKTSFYSCISFTPTFLLLISGLECCLEMKKSPW